jgi:hypothetical protein
VGENQLLTIGLLLYLKQFLKYLLFFFHFYKHSTIISISIVQSSPLLFGNNKRVFVFKNLIRAQLGKSKSV